MWEKEPPPTIEEDGKQVVYTNVFFLKKDPCRDQQGRFAYNHGPLVVDETSRTLTCKACGKVVDPIEAIIAWSRDENHLLWRYEELSRKIRITEQTLQKKRKCKCEFCGKMTDIGKAPANLAPIKP